MAVKTYSKDNIKYLNYKEEYKLIFPIVKALLLTYLPKITVEHIGSTAIPQHFGKNVLDILVVDHLNSKEKIDNKLNHIGFEKFEPEENNIAPLFCGSMNYNHQIFNIHIFVTEKDSDLHRSSMHIRNALLNVPEYRKAMEDCHSKAMSSGRFNENLYDSMKSEVFEMILSDS